MDYFAWQPELQYPVYFIRLQGIAAPVAALHGCVSGL